MKTHEELQREEKFQYLLDRYDGMFKYHANKSRTEHDFEEIYALIVAKLWTTIDNIDLNNKYLNRYITSICMTIKANYFMCMFRETKYPEHGFAYIDKPRNFEGEYSNKVNFITEILMKEDLSSFREDKYDTLLNDVREVVEDIIPTDINHCISEELLQRNKEIYLLIIDIDIHLSYAEIGVIYGITRETIRLAKNSINKIVKERLEYAN